MSQFSIWPRNFATAVHHFSFCQSFASLQNEHHHPQKKSNNKQHCVRRRTTLPVQVAPFKLKKITYDVDKKNCCAQQNPFYQVVFYLFCCNMLYVVICCSYCSNMSLQYAKDFFNSPSSTIKLFSSIYRKDIRYRHTICTWTHW